ncbi:hypothetical protein [Rhodopseudomonas sp. RCAM05734]|uniref:hypothetical protein n=1 Tax=Rhodopseudomonas sp. RCAM05734 TaxID=3457549 RepID=UPI00404506D3
MKITANRSDEEPGRITRLEQVQDTIAAKKLRTAVLALHDHKGTLYVDWATIPRTEDLSAVLQIWSDQNEVHSNHSVKGQPLIWDVGGYNPFNGPSFP